MIDQRFYGLSIPQRVGDIAVLVNGEITSPGDAEKIVHKVSTAKRADAGAICFAQNKEALEALRDKKDVVCLVSAEGATLLGKDVIAIIVSEPKRAFSLVIDAMYPQNKPNKGHHPQAIIAPDAIIAEDTIIEAGVVIGREVEIGAGAWIKAGTSIGDNCIIGADCILEPNVVIMYSMIGVGSHIGAGSIIGYSGFGVNQDDERQNLIHHLGRVIIGDRCHIGANVCIDRGMIDDTFIGNEVMIDNLVQISHNVYIGDGNVICGQTGIAGSSTVGESNIFGAQSGVADHVTIGSKNIFAARAGVTKNIGSGVKMAGFPATAMTDFQRQVLALRRLASPKKK